MKTVTLARKPIIGTVATNVIKHGCGGLNIDACRIGTEVMTSISMSSLGVMHDDEWQSKPIPPTQKEGRWPSNTILNEDVAEVLDEQSGELKGGGSIHSRPLTIFGNESGKIAFEGYSDTGGASRFFKQVKQ